MARDFDSEKFDAIASVGGDGSIHETLTGLMAREPAQRPPCVSLHPPILSHAVVGV